ncbi:peptidoglycan DD-metalloendopeptidase family protein [Undibacterium sp. TS12]|uniref:peptidoglycan DD-metalloendopeptidase family protein n=1 Tax=Undibacterium sp. TS12 TaxID=2908202 RepID=UPI001F4CD776|nr:peptidoglycan DD-metalloendopeptidase family protein [Undibacterium sp. TS12]MCH8618839.1 peptidoglycan DD-metalloendopeptidase family protein [Undibacterium sp. TS12]
MKNIQQRLQTGFALCILAGLTACTTTLPNKAPVVERGVDQPPVEVTPPPVVNKSPVVVKAPENARGTYVVKRGDGLYRIALDHGQSYSDLVTWNDLKNPNDIKVGQVLRVAPPEGAATTQTTAVTPSSAAVEVKPLPSNQVINKNSPRGDKRAYSETNLAELQKTDTVVAAVAPTVKNDVAAPIKATETAPAESDVVDWMWPADGKVLATFDDVKNKGFDISGKMGQDVLAAGAGRVMYAGSGIRGYGNLVIIKHTSSLLSAYAHNKAILVKEGQAISRGQKIAEMGNSDSDIVKLHFEIRVQGKPVDPAKYLPGR